MLATNASSKPVVPPMGDSLNYIARSWCLCEATHTAMLWAGSRMHKITQLSSKEARIFGVVNIFSNAVFCWCYGKEGFKVYSEVLSPIPDNTDERIKKFKRVTAKYRKDYLKQGAVSLVSMCVLACLYERKLISVGKLSGYIVFQVMYSALSYFVSSRLLGRKSVYWT